MIYNYVLQLLLRTSILLNLSLLLYLSLSAGWTVAGPGDAAAAPHPEPYSRGILNQYFGHYSSLAGQAFMSPSPQRNQHPARRWLPAPSLHHHLHLPPRNLHWAQLSYPHFHCQRILLVKTSHYSFIR